MNKKEARKILDTCKQKDGPTGTDVAKALVYLEAIEKAKVLGVFLSAFLQDTDKDDFDYWERAAEALSQWEKEK